MQANRGNETGRGASGERHPRERFPAIVKSVGDRFLARQISKLPRPWEARSGEVYAIERRAVIDGAGDVSFSGTEVGYWRRSPNGTGDMPVSVFDLPTEELKKVAPLVALSLEDNRHADLVGQHIRYHHETRSGSTEVWIPERHYVCLSFWGGMAVIEESIFENFLPGDTMVPRVLGGVGFGFIWKEVSRASVPDACHDMDILLGKYISDRVYPGLPEPVPTGRQFGAEMALDDRLLL